MMRFLFSKFFIILYSSLLYYSCANIKPPIGGPKDTIPPLLVRSFPPNKSINYKGNSIRLVYSEYLKVNNLKKELIITPIANFDFTYKFRRNSIEISFLNPLKDSTTYTLNFQSTIQDITEGNISTDNTFAFSTGNYIDSLYITGKVTDLLTNKPMKGITVGLYSVLDTLNLFKGRPLYFTRSNECGQFRIENIKPNNYLAQYFKDVNNNLTCDMPREPYGFRTDTLRLLSNSDSIFMKIQYLDIRPLKIQKAIPSGKYFEIGFNKSIVNYRVHPIDSSITLYHNFADKGKTIRFYNTNNFDSLQITLDAEDSVGNLLKDTLYVKFQESKRKKEDFIFSLNPPNNSAIDIDLQAEITFSKPVKSISTDSLYIRYDSAHVDSINTKTDITLNNRRDIITLHKALNKEILEPEQKPEVSTNQPNQTELNTKAIAKSQAASLWLYMGKGAFISVEADSSKLIKSNYKIRNEENFGIIRGSVQSAYKSYFIQLLDNKYNVVAEINSQSPFSFQQISPGDYQIRVLVDDNNNGKWEPGNFDKNMMPEDVYYYPQILTLRANWELRDIVLSF